MVPLPEMIANFAVTYKCNSRCKTCSIWKYESNQRELAINEIRDFLTSNKELFRKIKTIQITGGEPYLRDDLDQVVKVKIGRASGRERVCVLV
jgi:molybdenum cofactor biosynthesis enzyme MoaA